MNKIILTVLFVSVLNGAGIEDKALDSIYQEAMWFVGVFTFMSVVSIIISKKNAAKYEVDNPIDIRRAALQKEKDLLDATTKRMPELVKLYEDGLINKKEYKMLLENIEDLVS